MELHHAKAAVIVWAHTVGIFDKGTPQKQVQKTFEEVQELITELNAPEPNMQRVTDELGDVYVTLEILTTQLGLTQAECLNAVLPKLQSRIKHGEMIDGTFVKNVKANQ
jgi:NTP pyrophosphatase (non-canonical NTP hydrolase)